MLHKLSKYIVDIATTFKSEIVLEDLSNIKHKILNKNKILNRKLSLAPLRKIQQMILYKAKWYRIPVDFKNPKNTSSLCPVCNHRVVMTAMPRATLCPNCNTLYHRDFLACLNLAKSKMGGVRVPHDRPMKWIRKGAVLPNDVSTKGILCAMMDSYAYA